MAHKKALHQADEGQKSDCKAATLAPVYSAPKPATIQEKPCSYYHPVELPSGRVRRLCAFSGHTLKSVVAAFCTSMTMTTDGYPVGCPLFRHLTGLAEVWG